MEPFTYKLFSVIFALLDDLSMLFSQIESDTSTDRIWAAQIEPALYSRILLSMFVCFVCLFDLILYVPSTIFQLYRDGSSWIEPVLS